MSFAASPTLADRLAWLIDGLCKAIGADARKQRMDAALAWAVYHRVRLLGDRLIALATRVRAGRVMVRRSRTRHPDRSASRPDLPQGERELPSRERELRLPRGFGWVRQALPQTAAYAGVLTFLLHEAEMKALVEKAPQAGRILRPLCHLLGVTAPAFLSGGGEMPTGPDAPVAEAARTDEEPAQEPVPPASVESEGSAPSPEPHVEQSAPRVLSWLEEDAAAMRERVARWVAQHADPPSTLLPLGVSRELDHPDTRPFWTGSKNRG